MNPIKKQSISFKLEQETIKGHLYTPETGANFPGVVVAGPMTSVKEQVTGTYAQALAHRGYAALAIDHRYYGESSGEPRQFEYYRHKIEDLIAAVELLGTHAKVDNNNIGMMGICLGCGYASWAASQCKTIKWLGLVVGYYRDVEMIKAADPIAYTAKINQGISAREHYEETAEILTIPAVSADGEAAMSSANLFDYYQRRAKTNNYTNAFALMSREFFLSFDVQSAAGSLNIPVRMVHSNHALSPQSARKFFSAIHAPKEQLWLVGKSQDDFYDNPDLVNRATDFISNRLTT